MKHTRPDLANAVRELSKVLDGATEAHMKDLFRVIGYTLETAKLGLPIEVQEISNKEVWIIEAWSDSDFAGDRDTRKSVTAWEIYVNGVLVSYKSRLQKTVTLSSCEAEYVALCETCQEILHIRQIIKTMGCTVQYPIIVHVDNVGTMFLASNETTYRTKHIDIKWHFIRELIEEPNPMIKLVHARTEENKADHYSKNVPNVKFHAHFNNVLKKL